MNAGPSMFECSFIYFPKRTNWIRHFSSTTIKFATIVLEKISISQYELKIIKCCWRKNHITFCRDGFLCFIIHLTILFFWFQEWKTIRVYRGQNRPPIFCVYPLRLENFHYRFLKLPAWWFELGLDFPRFPSSLVYHRNFLVFEKYYDISWKRKSWKVETRLNRLGGKF